MPTGLRGWLVSERAALLMIIYPTIYQTRLMVFRLSARLAHRPARVSFVFLEESHIQYAVNGAWQQGVTV
jgi:hypothetical protein